MESFIDIYNKQICRLYTIGQSVEANQLLSYTAQYAYTGMFPPYQLFQQMSLFKANKFAASENSPLVFIWNPDV